MYVTSLETVSFYVYFHLFSSDTFGALLTASAGIRGSSMLLHHPTANATAYLERDMTFRKACCGATNLCDLFFERRPSNDCRGYEPPFWGELYLHE